MGCFIYYELNFLPSNQFGFGPSSFPRHRPTRFKFGEWRAQQWQDRKNELDELSRSIGVDEEGWVPAEDFEEIYDRYRKVKEWISKDGTEIGLSVGL